MSANCLHGRIILLLGEEEREKGLGNEEVLDATRVATCGMSYVSHTGKGGGDLREVSLSEAPGIREKDAS